MCLAVPMEIIKIDGNGFGIAYAGGIEYGVNLSLIDEPATGDHVIVHAGFAIEKLDVDEAENRLELFEELANLQSNEL